MLRLLKVLGVLGALHQLLVVVVNGDVLLVVHLGDLTIDLLDVGGAVAVVSHHSELVSEVVADHDGVSAFDCPLLEAVSQEFDCESCHRNSFVLVEKLVVI